jgi:hypothetical protein
VIIYPFSPGDKVELRSGGPVMTVERIDGDRVDCVFFTLEEIAWDSEDGHPVGNWRGPFYASFMMGALDKWVSEEEVQ